MPSPRRRQLPPKVGAPSVFFINTTFGAFHLLRLCLQQATFDSCFKSYKVCVPARYSEYRRRRLCIARDSKRASQLNEAGQCVFGCLPNAAFHVFANDSRHVIHCSSTAISFFGRHHDACESHSPHLGGSPPPLDREGAVRPAETSTPEEAIDLPKRIGDDVGNDVRNDVEK